MEDFNNSRCEIERAIFRSHDRSKELDLSANFITSFSLSQSMNTVAYNGSLNVLDTQGVLESFPLRGEERLDLWIKSYDLGTLIKLSARVYKVSDIIPSSNSNSVSYVLHFVSSATFDASIRNIIAPFNTSINRVAYEIFKNNYRNLPLVSEGDALDQDDKTKVLPFATRRYALKDEPYERNFFITPTVGIAKLIIPDMTPTEALHFISSKAYNPHTPSQTFRFFETFNDYYFCTDEYFIKDPKKVHKLFYAPNVDLGPENVEAQIERIEELNVLSKGIDSAMDVLSGSYRNEIVEVDLVRRNFSVSKFNFDNAKYIDMNGTQRNSQFNPHSDSFRRDVFTQENAKRFMVFRNYSRPGDIPSSLSQDRHYAEITQNRVSYFHHLNNTSVAVTLKGRLDINVGDMVNLDVKGLDSDNKVINNHALAGKYLVQAGSYNVDVASTLTTVLKLAKFDWDPGNSSEKSRDISDTVISGGAG